MISGSTPILFLYTDDSNNRIYVKREDMLPVSFGGNKARIAQCFIDDMRSKGKNCMIGYGNARSNLCRVLSDMCSINGIPCHMISPADDDGNRSETFNSLLAKQCGAVFHECLKSDVATTVENVIKLCVDDGYAPYYINGDKYGKGNEAVPVLAYKDAYDEISRQSVEINVRFEYIFLPTGTGMTQSGLLAGKALKNGSEKIVGISVARKAETEISIVENYLRAFEKSNGIGHFSYDINVDDSYLCSGYGKYDRNIELLIEKMYKIHGICLDPTYTGKAFYGMTEYLEKNSVSDSDVLFIHTGGTPLFFDYLKQRQIFSYPGPTLCDDYDLVYKFLCDIDDSLPEKLSERVNISDFTHKVLNNGKVIAVVYENQIVSASLFYCNDQSGRSAFITMFGTLAPFRKSGVSSKVIKESERYAKDAGMRYMRLETDISNNRAVSFYAKNGYSIDFVEKKIHMIKEL